MTCIFIHLSWPSGSLVWQSPVSGVSPGTLSTCIMHVGTVMSVCDNMSLPSTVLQVHSLCVTGVMAAHVVTTAGQGQWCLPRWCMQPLCCKGVPTRSWAPLNGSSAWVLRCMHATEVLMELVAQHMIVSLALFVLWVMVSLLCVALMLMAPVCRAQYAVPCAVCWHVL